MSLFGYLDASFGENGTGLVTTNFSANGVTGIRSEANYVAINQTNDKIVVGGFSRATSSNKNFALACYNQNGTLDASFGTQGLVVTDFDNNDDTINSIAINRTNGNIIVAGSKSSDFILACYKPNGNLDASFGTLGKTITNFGGSDSGQSVIINNNGNIIVAGYKDNIFALAGYKLNGTLDASFGNLGKFVSLFPGRAFSLAINQLNNKIYVGGHTAGNFVLARFYQDGRLDTEFGLGGTVVTDFGNTDVVTSLAINQTNGKIILAGNSSGLFALACYYQNGDLDTNFGLGGKVFSDYGFINDVKINSNGKIIVSGQTVANSINIFTIACYLPDGHLDASFGSLGTGKVVANFGENSTAKSIAITTNGDIIVAGSTNIISNQHSNFALAKYFGEVTEDPISNICFPENTLISTNQGNIAIQNLNPEIHTIRNKKIELITKTVTQDKYLVCFEKDSLGKNLPSEKTIITKNHLIYYNGSAIKAKDFINKFDNVKKIKYNGEALYNVLLKEHDKMMVNNLICETLHPENKISQLFKILSNLSPKDQKYVIKVYNDHAIKTNTFSSKR